MSTDNSTDDPTDHHAHRLMRLTMKLQVFVHASIDATREYLDRLQNNYEAEQSQSVKDALEELYIDGKIWLDRAQDLRAQLLLKSREIGVMVKRLEMHPQAQSLSDEVRQTLHSMLRLAETTRDRCLELLGKGPIEVIEEQAEAILESEEEADRYRQRNLARRTVSRVHQPEDTAGHQDSENSAESDLKRPLEDTPEEKLFYDPDEEHHDEERSEMECGPLWDQGVGFEDSILDGRQ